MNQPAAGFSAGYSQLTGGFTIDPEGGTALFFAAVDRGERSGVDHHIGPSPGQGLEEGGESTRSRDVEISDFDAEGRGERG